MSDTHVHCLWLPIYNLEV